MSARPSGCCGVCPPIVGGGFDCTCAGNPRCPNRTPRRIQRKRTKGWRMPEGAIVVSRPSKWGNPFRVVREPGVGWSLRGIPEEHGEWTGIGRELACAYAKGLYRSWITGQRIVDGLAPPTGSEIESLRGHDLACWCPVEFACHADILLELANG